MFTTKQQKQTKFDDSPSTSEEISENFIRNHTLNLSFYHQHCSQHDLIFQTIKLNQNHVQILEEHLLNLNQSAKIESNKLTKCIQPINDVENSVDQVLNQIKVFRQKIHKLKNCCVSKEQSIKNISIKQYNLLMLKQQLQNIKQLKQKIMNLQYYDQILEILKKQQFIPYQYVPKLCEDKLYTMMTINLPKYRECDYTWRLQDLDILKKTIRKILILKKYNSFQTEIRDSQKYNLTLICRRYVQIIKHIKFNSDDKQIWIYTLNQIWMEGLMQLHLSKSYQYFLEAKSIMQSSQESILFFQSLCSQLQSSKHKDFTEFIKQLNQIQSISQAQLRTWMKRYEQKYFWMTQTSITKQIEEIRILVTNKILRPLLVDFGQEDNSKIKLSDVKYHTYRIWKNYDKLYHRLHPIKLKNNVWKMLKIQNSKIIGSELQMSCEGIIDYINYSQILNALWKDQDQYEQIIQIWVKLVAEYIYRKQPYESQNLPQSINFLAHRIYKKYNDIVKYQLTENKLYFKYGDKKHIEEEGQQEIYSFIIKNKLSSFNIKTINDLSKKIGCNKQITDLRQNAYRPLFQNCKLCTKQLK